MTKSTQSIAKKVRLGDLSLDYNWSDIGEQQAVELIELATRNVRLSHKPMTTPQYENLVIPEGYIKSGTGYASMDLAYFRRPPDAKEDGPLDTMEIDAQKFMRVARPGQIESTQDGRDYVPAVHDSTLGVPGTSGNNKRKLPEGWTVREVKLKNDLVVDLSTPKRAAFFFSGESFQGPVILDP
jgi:hypothetical protein